jgi:hypothetical protein
MSNEIQCTNNERPKGKRIEVDMHYCDILVINCHDHDGNRRIYETKTLFMPERTQTVRGQFGMMYHKLLATIKAEQEEQDDEIIIG